MDNQPPESASTPVTPTGTAYIPPVNPNPPTSPLPTNPTPPAPPSPVTPPLAQNPLGDTTPPKPHSKMLMMIMGLLLLVVLAGGGYFYFISMQNVEEEMKPVDTVKTLPTLVPTATPMATDSATASVSADPDSIGADWKTYTNTHYGYSIKYPPTFFTEEVNLNELENGDISLEYFKLPLSTGEIPREISLYVPQNIQTLEEFINTIRVGDGPPPKLTREKITVNGESGEKVTDIPSANGQLLIVLPNQKSVLAIVLSPYVPGENKTEDEWISTFNQMLSTFKFIE